MKLLASSSSSVITPEQISQIKKNSILCYLRWNCIHLFELYLWYNIEEVVLLVLTKISGFDEYFRENKPVFKNINFCSILIQLKEWKVWTYNVEMTENLFLGENKFSIVVKKTYYTVQTKNCPIFWVNSNDYGSVWMNCMEIWNWENKM